MALSTPIPPASAPAPSATRPAVCAVASVAAFQAGGKAKEAGAIADRIMEKYGQRDQSAALRTCVRLAIKGRDCEGQSLDGNNLLPTRSTRAEKCGYSDDKCMSSADIAAFGKCMRETGEQL